MRMGNGRRAALAAVLGAVLLVPLTTAALAADATGCSGSAISQDADGIPVDTVKVPGPGGTESDPFLVDLDGSVAWKGSTDAVITNGTWSVSVMGVPMFSGDFPNDEGKASDAGTVSMAELPSIAKFFMQGSQVIPVAGELTGTGGSCTGSGYISAQLPATGTPLWITAMVMLAVALFLLFGVFITTTAPAAVASSSPGVGVGS